MSGQQVAEAEAREALRKALEALQVADAACERAGYGSQVVAPMASAMADVQYALDVAEGRR